MAAEEAAVPPERPGWPGISDVSILTIGNDAKLYCLVTGELVDLEPKAVDYRLNDGEEVLYIESESKCVREPAHKLLKSRVAEQGGKTMVQWAPGGTWRELEGENQHFMAKVFNVPIEDWLFS